jgi:hypothetical protein
MIIVDDFDTQLNRERSPRPEANKEPEPEQY